MGDVKQKILLSGVKPTGRPHVGNFFGAMKQFVDLQDDYQSFVFIADLHGLNTIKNRDEMRELSLGIALDYLAIGLDPQKTTIFRQSDIPEIAELAWIFNSITTMPYLMRAHAYKDSEAKNKEINVGTFDYPMLMAADILIQDTDVVPVGQDQKQHIEITRDTAEKFNHIFGETFKLPEALILKDVAVVPGTDGRKMSKSYGNTIELFGTDEDIKKAVMSIVTDSKSSEESKDEEKCNIFALHKLFNVKELADIKKRYKEGGIGYKESKEILLKNIIALVGPMRERRSALLKNKDEVLTILKNGGEIARGRARIKLQEVREKTGLI